MNCEECKENVFDLIEREATEGEEVARILERCPDCRTLFDEMKAALVAVDGLPLEEPPVRIDAEVLRAAAERRRGGEPRMGTRFGPVPWAAAAVALLAVGLGVWARPSMPDTPARVAQAPDESVQAAGETVAGVASEPASPRKAAHDEAAYAEDAEAHTRSRSRQAAERPAAAAVSASEPVPKAKREGGAAEGLAADAARVSDAGENADVEVVAETSAAAIEAKPQSAPVPSDSDCRAAFRAQRSAKKRGDTDRLRSTQELTLGLCYLDRGDDTLARTWLERAAEHPETQVRARDALDRLALEERDSPSP